MDARCIPINTKDIMKQIANFILEKLIINKNSKIKKEFSKEDYEKYIINGSMCSFESIKKTINNCHKLSSNQETQLIDDLKQYFNDNDKLYYKYRKVTIESTKLPDSIEEQIKPSVKPLYQKVFYAKNIGFYVKELENPKAIVLIIKFFYSGSGLPGYGNIREWQYYFKMI